ncbi:MAG TPA: sigma-54-dependent Fis family transcriptional regulator, partial [Desulfurivibrionaceae bacterium]|nr:sigma-54-dependent Fis family transcriptional regulator [Desulfurivibrionaceae bacterium]
VDRGSVWIRKPEGFCCIEAEGIESDKVKGLCLPLDAKSLVRWVIETGKMALSRPDGDPRHFQAIEADLAIKSSLILGFPLLLKDGTVYGVVEIIDTNPEHSQINLEKKYLEFLQELVNIGSVALSNALEYDKQCSVSRLLQSEIEALKEDGLVVGQSGAFQQVMTTLASYAATDYPVLVTGESGTGKELVATRLHRLSPRREQSLVVQNCSAIPETLLESELFGYKKGAFSGAVRDKKGLFEAADGGTLFLDEIGDMPIELQAKVLRVIQSNEIKPVGSTETRRVDVRLVAATNRNLEAMVKEKAFRRDLFYRLSVLPITLPPLRERQEDIPLLFSLFLRREAAKNNTAPKRVTREALALLAAYPWPGNIRELENLAKYLTVVCVQEEIGVADLPPAIAALPSSPEPTRPLPATKPQPPASTMPVSGLDFGQRTWEEVERDYATYLLQHHHMNMTWAAEAAGVNRSTFVSRLRRLNLTLPRRRRSSR